MSHKSIFAFLIFFVILAFSFSLADARSGCCSHHGGVCGCGCCDGSALSATCAPYYPSCSSPAAAAVIAPKVAVPSPTRISEFNQAMDYVKNQQSAYLQNSNGFREKLVSELTKKYKTLKIDNIGLIVYSQLQDIK